MIVNIIPKIIILILLLLFIPLVAYSADDANINFTGNKFTLHISPDAKVYKDDCIEGESIGEYKAFGGATVIDLAGNCCELKLSDGLSGFVHAEDISKLHLDGTEADEEYFEKSFKRPEFYWDSKAYTKPDKNSNIIDACWRLGRAKLISTKEGWSLISFESGAEGFVNNDDIKSWVSVDEKEVKKFKRVTFELEIDAYYTSAGLYINFTDKPVLDAGEKGELEIYRDLLIKSFVPRFGVLEAAVFPMPYLGTAIKRNAKSFYQSSELSEEFNFVKSVTAGFEEPFSIGLFLGNVIRFSRPKGDGEAGNFGYIGYLASAGNFHIKDNELIEDDWIEVEAKIKGDREFSDKKLNWSYRVGAKLHQNPEISDIVYIGIRRSRLNFNKSSKSIMNNSGIEYRFDMDRRNLDPVRHYFYVDKKFPWKEKKIAFLLALGFIWEADSKYSGSLKTGRDGSDFQFFIRPNISF